MLVLVACQPFDASSAKGVDGGPSPAIKGTTGPSLARTETAGLCPVCRWSLRIGFAALDHCFWSPVLAKPVSRFVCQSCGAVTLKWAGRCETCGEWNTVEEETVVARPGPAAKAAPVRGIAFVGLAGSAEPPPRSPIGIAELDRVLGGGLVPASAVLVGGDPGIGKSTLLTRRSSWRPRSTCGRSRPAWSRRRIPRWW
jgi:hypothetical protein